MRLWFIKGVLFHVLLYAYSTVRYCRYTTIFTFCQFFLTVQNSIQLNAYTIIDYWNLIIIAYCRWFGFSKKTGLSPLAPGQWKGFLAVYAGFYVFNNIIRPMRLAVSVGVTPYFDRAVAAVQRKTKLGKGASIGIVVFLANICGTFSFMALGIYIASLAAGIPIFPPKV